jgi:hypothetical protein
MAKNILRRQFSNVYGKDKVLPSKNSIESLLTKMNGNDSNGPQLKTIMKNEFQNVYGKESNTNTNRNLFPDIKPSNLTISAIIFLTVTLLLVTILYYYRNNIIEYFKKIMSNIKIDSSGTVSELENKYDILFDSINKKLEKDEKEVSEIKSKLSEHELHTIHKEEQTNKEKETKIETGGVASLNTKIEKKYKDNQIVKGNGFCYIGFDNHMRECTDVYEGDICMSGQIFPTMDICLNPEFRN